VLEFEYSIDLAWRSCCMNDRNSSYVQEGILSRMFRISISK